MTDPWADFDDEWSNFKEAWTARGFRLPPSGGKEDPGTQRGLVWEIVSARPADAGRWCREAPGSTTRAVVGYILSEWHKLRKANEAAELAERIGERDRDRARRRRPHDEDDPITNDWSRAGQVAAGLDLGRRVQ
jgi:hypothetical protein